MLPRSVVCGHVGLWQLVGGSSGPRYSLLHFQFKVKILVELNNLSFIHDECWRVNCCCCCHNCCFCSLNLMKKGIIVSWCVGALLSIFNDLMKLIYQLTLVAFLTFMIEYSRNYGYVGYLFLQVTWLTFKKGQDKEVGQPLYFHLMEPT